MTAEPSAVRPIPTRYAGCHFRSRLEARWAVFFDRLGIGWDYEPQGYVIEGLGPYLPDLELLLPAARKVFAEVKPPGTDDFEGEHVDLCRGLAAGTGRQVVLLTGPPAVRAYSVFSPEAGLAFFRDYADALTMCDDYWRWYLEEDPVSGAPVFGHDYRSAGKSFGQKFLAAIEAARSARFEHGENPERVIGEIMIPCGQVKPEVWS